MAEKKRLSERSYWIAVIKTHDFDEDFSISMLLGRKWIRSIVISKPCYSDVYHQMVRYASFSFFKSVPKSYFGTMFDEKNDLVPIQNVIGWVKKRKNTYYELMKPLGFELEYVNESKRSGILKRSESTCKFIV